MLQPLGNRDVTKLVIYSDASLGNLPDGGTQGVVMLSFLLERMEEFHPCVGSQRRSKELPEIH